MGPFQEETKHKRRSHDDRLLSDVIKNVKKCDERRSLGWNKFENNNLQRGKTIEKKAINQKKEWITLLRSKLGFQCSN